MPLAYLPPGATPLPWRQILILCLARLPEPINYTIIFPFINQMIVEETGVRVEDVGFYSGIIEGVFALVQFAVVFHWGALSDRLGRRPVILIGLVGVCLSGLSFGFSKSFAAMLLTRCMAGCLSGNVAVVKASLGEMTDSTNQGVAFPLYGLTWITGTIMGSTIGGFFSHPAERYPTIFGDVEILVKYPFLLPCGTSAAITACSFLFAFFFLYETLEKPPPTPSSSSAYPRVSLDEESHELLDSSSSPSLARFEPFSSSSPPSSSNPRHKPPVNPKHHLRKPSFSPLASLNGIIGRANGHKRHDSNAVGARRDSSGSVATEWGFWILLGLPLIQRVVLSSFLLAGVASSFQAVSLLIFYSPISQGGLGMNAGTTGSTLAFQGLWSLIVQLVFLPPLQTRYGTAPLYRLFNSGWIATFFLLPFLNFLARSTASENSTPDGTGAGLSTWVWFAMVWTLAASVVFNTSQSLVMILINTVTPSKSALGALNGITTMAGSLARSMGPAFVSSLFAISQSPPSSSSPSSSTSPSSIPPDRSSPRRHIWWICMVLLCCLNAAVGFAVKEGDNGASAAAVAQREREREAQGRKGSAGTIDEEEEGDMELEGRTGEGQMTKRAGGE